MSLATTWEIHDKEIFQLVLSVSGVPDKRGYVGDRYGKIET